MNRQEQVKRRGIKQILYAFRRAHGVPADLYIASVGTPDFKTGDKAYSRVKIPIPQCITGEVDLSRKFEYDLSYVAANKNFTYGGYFEIGDRLMIIDQIYLGKTEIEQKDYVVYDGKRYDIQRLTKLDADCGYMLHVRHTKGSKPYQIIERTIVQRLVIEQEVEFEL